MEICEHSMDWWLKDWKISIKMKIFIFTHYILTRCISQNKPYTCINTYTILYITDIIDSNRYIWSCDDIDITLLKLVLNTNQSIKHINQQDISCLLK
jgi:hypothetical protein